MNPAGQDAFELEAYLRRIGLDGHPAPTLHEVHRAHVVTIPFENLDPQRGVVPSLQPAELQRKLVSERRGGYCFEQNLLLAAALEAMGHRVEPMLGRVRMGRQPGDVGPRTHLLLRVHADGAVWHADAGFGAGTLWEPIPFGPGRPHEQAGWSFRVVVDGPELLLQAAGADGAWVDQYGFEPRPVPLIDIETSNWFTATYTRSPFVTGLNVAAQTEDGTLTSLSDWSELALVEQTPRSRTATPVTRAEIPALLAERFELPGFELGADGRLVRGEQPAPPPAHTVSG